MADSTKTGENYDRPKLYTAQKVVYVENSAAAHVVVMFWKIWRLCAQTILWKHTFRTPFLHVYVWKLKTNTNKEATLTKPLYYSAYVQHNQYCWIKIFTSQVVIHIHTHIFTITTSPHFHHTFFDTMCPHNPHNLPVGSISILSYAHILFRNDVAHDHDRYGSKFMLL